MNEKDELKISLNEHSSVKRLIAVVSGKGGVGKSFVTSRLAALFQKKGYRTAVLDADITGPSIPKCFGVKEKAVMGEKGIEPVLTKTGLQVLSVNVLLDDEATPVVWRGPVISGTVKRFWTDTFWSDVDYMFVDMPPGTGDVPLTVFQSLPIDGIIIVTSPQELVSMIVKKAVNMAETMNVPVFGLVENYSYIKCLDCGKVMYPFGEGKTDDISAEYGIPVLARLPIDAKIAEAMDKGEVENLESDVLEDAAVTIDYLLKDKIFEKKEEEEDVFSESHRIALPFGNGGNIQMSFSKSESFLIVDTKGREILKREVIEMASGNKDSFAAILIGQGIDTLICTAIGPKDREKLTSKGVRVIPGISGLTEEAISIFLAGGYKDSLDKGMA